MSWIQYDSTEGKSIIDAIEAVVQPIGMTKDDSRRTKEKCVMVALDVRNTFNIIAWTAIKEEIEH